MNSSHLVIGSKGEVGLALVKLLKEKFTVFENDIDYNTNTNNETVDFIHICMGYNDKFQSEVIGYYDLYSKESTIVIIHSTVVPFTTKELSKEIEYIVYSPIRGVHPHLYKYLLHWTKFIASENTHALFRTSDMFALLGMEVRSFNTDPTALEFAKHFSTKMYGFSLVSGQELALLSREYNFDPKVVMDFVNDTGKETHDRKIYPFTESIGGHCVIQNARLIANISELANDLIRYNDNFTEEVKKRRIYFDKKEEQQ